MTPCLRIVFVSLYALASLIWLTSSSRAEGQLRVSDQFGTVYLPIEVVRDRKLVEKHGKALGLDIVPEWHRFSGGAAVNDALLSGNIDIAGAGIGPFLTIWDRTLGTSLEVKIVGALGAQPNYLLTNKANIKSLTDFGKTDKIALPAAGVSVQSRILQIAAEQAFGKGHEKELDDITVTLPHPDATAALVSGSTEITGHISNAPYQDLELKDPKIHKVFSSYDILGGKVTPSVLYATVKFRTENPKTYQAFVEALEEATDWIAANPAEAVQVYIRTEKSKMDPAFLQNVLEDPEVRYTVVPLGSKKFADFLARTKAIKHKPERWTDYVFENLRGEDGS